MRRGTRDFYDAVIVGLGMSSLAALREFSDRTDDYRVLVVEREAVWRPWLNDPVEEPGAYLLDNGSTINFRRAGSPDLPKALTQWWSSRRAGGGFNRWYGQMSRFQPVDFDGSFGPRWPIEYEELEHWYGRVEKDLSPYGCSYGWDESTYRRLDCRNFRNRSVSSMFERMTVDRLRDNGLDAYIGQTCLGGRYWETSPIDPESLQLSVSHPLLVRPNYYVEVLQKIANDERFEVWDQCEADGIEWISEAAGARLAVRHHGVQRSVQAAFILLGCGPLATCSLLLRSGLKAEDPRIGTGLTFTLERVAYALLDVGRSVEPLDSLIGSFSSTVVKSYYQYESGGMLRKGGKYALYDAAIIESEARRRQQLSRTGTDVDEFLAAEASGQQSVKFSFKGESDVSPKKFLTIDGESTTIHYTPTIGDLRRQDDVESQIHEILRALGATSVHLQEIPDGSALVSAHHHGGAPAAAGNGGVLDEWCEIGAWKTVHVIDGSFMPTSGGTNSSLTVMANARRVASHVIERMADHYA